MSGQCRGVDVVQCGGGGLKYSSPSSRPHQNRITQHRSAVCTLRDPSLSDSVHTRGSHPDRAHTHPI